MADRVYGLEARGAASAAVAGRVVHLRADLADYVIGRLTQAAPGSATVTFDRRLDGHPLFDVLGA